jgi:Aminotransferase class-III
MCSCRALLQQGEGGIVPASKEYFAAIREICDETGALMMCDEVQVSALFNFKYLIIFCVIDCSRRVDGL